jgi:hypothetical protein
MAQFTCGRPDCGHGPYVFHGHPYAWHPVHFPRPWVYPPGYDYRLWAVGAILPPLFWSTPTYYYTGWDAMGLPPPDPGFQYIEYGPDLLRTSPPEKSSRSFPEFLARI